MTLTVGASNDRVLDLRQSIHKLNYALTIFQDKDNQYLIELLIKLSY